VFFPEFLYQLSAKDQQVTWLDPVTDIISATINQTTIDLIFTVPDGRALILKALQIFAIPGAGQTTSVRQLHVNRRAPDTSEIRLVRSDVVLGAGVAGNEDWQGEILLMPGWRLFGRAVFNALVNANTVNLSLAGILIPIANIQRI